MFCCTCDNFCKRMRLHHDCCPQLDNQCCDILHRAVHVTLYLRQAHSHRSHLLQTTAQVALACLTHAADSAKNALKLMPWRSTGQPSLPCLWIPINTHATQVQHPCVLRATQVQNTRTTYATHMQHCSGTRALSKFTSKFAFIFALGDVSD